MIIYKATFPNGKSYIGQTTQSLKARKKKHKYDYNSKNNVFYRAIRKYGWENIIWEVIDTADKLDVLDEREIYWIKYYNTYIHWKNANGYNMTTGGHGVNNRWVSEETKQKLSIALKGKLLGEKNPLFGIPRSEEVKRKISIARKGKFSGEEHYLFGKHLSEKTKIKISEANKGHIMSEEFCKNQSERVKGKNHPLYGKHHTEESKKKMSESKKGVKPSIETRQKWSEHRKGEGNSHAKITKEIAKQIKIRLASGDNPIDIANDLNVTNKIVFHIKYLTAWKDLLPVLNDLLEDKKLKRMDKNTAKEIKIRLSNGEQVIDLAEEFHVSKTAVQQIKGLNSWEKLLPELNDKLKGLINKSLLYKRL